MRIAVLGLVLGGFVFILRAGGYVLLRVFIGWVCCFVIWFGAEPLTRVSVGGKCGFANDSGAKVIASKYSRCGEFADGLAPVASGDRHFGEDPFFDTAIISMAGFGKA
jgi:hypothetical protein